MVDIFKFQDAREYLHAIFAQSKKENSAYTLSLWAKDLGYDNPSTLSSVLRGVRPLGQKIRSTIKLRYKLAPKEQLYFDLIANYGDTDDPKQKSFFYEMIRSTNEDAALHFVDNDKFQSIADWWHIAIIELLKLPSVQGTLKDLGSALKPFVSKDQIEQAVIRLKRLGIVEQEGNRLYLKTDHLVTGDRGRSEAVQMFHEGLLKVSQQRLKSEPIERRDFRATFIPIKAENLQKAKELAAEFHKKIYDLVADQDADMVLQLHSQLMVWGSENLGGDV